MRIDPTRVTQVIYHSADYDGKLSAAIMLRHFAGHPDNLTLTGWNFGDPRPEVSEAVDQILVVDLPFHAVGPEVYHTQGFHWVDHHIASVTRAAAEYPKGAEPLGYRIDGVAACRLLWQYLHFREDWALPQCQVYVDHIVKEPDVVRLIGEWDVWDHRDEDATFLHYGLSAEGLTKPEELVDTLRWGRTTGVAKGLLDRIIEHGAAAWRWHRGVAEWTGERGYLCTWEGVTFFVMNSAHASNSSWLPQALPVGTQALLCWHTRGDAQVRVSLYHAPGHEDLDLAAIAVKHGGGGHKGACGFAVPWAVADGFILSDKWRAE